MPHYLTTVSYTAQGAKGLLSEGGSTRREMVKQMVDSLGGSLETMYFTFGETDVIIIWSAPSNADVAAISLTAGAAGSVGVSTTVLLTPEEIDEAAKKAIDYRPPGS